MPSSIFRKIIKLRNYTKDSKNALKFQTERLFDGDDAIIASCTLRD